MPEPFLQDLIYLYKYLSRGFRLKSGRSRGLRTKETEVDVQTSTVPFAFQISISDGNKDYPEDQRNTYRNLFVIRIFISNLEDDPTWNLHAEISQACSLPNLNLKLSSLQFTFLVVSNEFVIDP